MDRSEDALETMIVVSSSEGWQIRAIIDDGSGKRSGSLADQIRSSLGLDQESFEILVIGVAFAVLILGLVTLVALSAQGLRWIGNRRSMDKESSVIMEDDVVDIVGQTDISIGIDEVEIIDDGVTEDGDLPSPLQTRNATTPTTPDKPQTTTTNPAPLDNLISLIVKV